MTHLGRTIVFCQQYCSECMDKRRRQGRDGLDFTFVVPKCVIDLTTLHDELLDDNGNVLYSHQTEPDNRATTLGPGVKYDCQR